MQARVSLVVAQIMLQMEQNNGSLASQQRKFCDGLEQRVQRDIEGLQRVTEELEVARQAQTAGPAGTGRA